jgi:hypothetical protein
VLRQPRFCFAAAAPLLAVSALLMFGCGEKSRQADARLEQMQAELEKLKKEAQQSRAELTEQPKPQRSAETTPPAAPDQTAAKRPATPTPKPEKKTTAQDATAAVEADLAASKTAVRKAIGEDRAAIASNRADIEANRERIATAQQTAEEAKRMAAPPPEHTIPAGTPLTVRTTNTISTKTAATGSVFEATLEEPLVIDGYTVAGKGATVEGVVTKADPGGRVKGVASLTVAVRSVTTDDGRRLPIRTDTVSEEAGKARGKDARRIGIATGIGAAIGAIAGGGKGAAIGAGAGAAGSTGLALATRGQAAEIPAESKLTFKLTSPVRVRELRK